jgi:N-acetylglutamate synthase-like GNAT family acetyltransferase
MQLSRQPLTAMLSAFPARRTAEGFRVRRITSPSEITPLLLAHEPRSTQALSDLIFRGLLPWRNKVWVVEDGGSPLAVVMVVRRAFDLWAGNVLLLDPRATHAVAHIVDRSKAISLNGVGADVGGVLPLLTRLHFANNLPFIVAEYPHDHVDAPMDGTRVATLADLDALVELYRNYEYGYEVTLGQLRTTMRRILREQIAVVFEVDGQIVGATLTIGRTGRYLIGDGMTVLPAHRKSGATWRLGARAQAVANGLGLSAIAFLAPSNPVVIDALIHDDAWLTSRLHPRRRFRGHNRLRSLVYRGRQRSHREPESFRDPQDPTNRYIDPTQTTETGKVIRNG